MSKIHTMRRLAAVLFVMMLAVTAIITVPMAGDSSADSKYSVSDDRATPNTLYFDEPFKYVVTLGLAFTSTVVNLGEESKLILVDTNSKSALSEGSTIPTISTSNYDDVGAKITTLVTEKGITKDDVLIIMYSYSSTGIGKLETQGYSKIMGFYPKSYDNVVTYVDKMETLIGADHSKSKEMADKANDIVSKMSDYSGDKVKGIYISYSSSKPQIANKNSIAVSMMEKCGAINAGYDADKSASYEPSSGMGPFLVSKINDDGLKVIFLDGNYSGTVADFIEEYNLGDKDVKVYKIEKTWNSYTPEITDGLNYMSKCLYPSVFGSPDGDDTQPFNYTTIIIMVVAAVIVIGAIFVVLRRR